MDFTTEAYNIWDIRLNGIGLIINTIGLFAVIYQIIKLKQPIQNNTHAALFSQSLELIRFLNENQACYYCFYENHSLPKNEDDKIHVLFAAEALANFSEQLLLQKKNMPKKQWSVWRNYIETSLDNSIVLIDFIQSRKVWYSKELTTIVDERIKNRTARTTLNESNTVKLRKKRCKFNFI